MPAKYALPRRITFLGDPVLAARYIPRGDLLLGIFVNALRERGLSSGRQVKVENEVTYTLDYNSVVTSLTIDVRGVQGGAQTSFNIWVPRGFVVYPATDTAPLGWGMPIQQDSSVSVFDAKNRAPGLDVTRWTTAGPLGQMLLTRVPKAGYPAIGTALAPMYFSTTFGPAPRKSSDISRLDIYLDSFAAGWKAYRLELTAYQGTNSGVKQGVFLLTNQDRAGIGRDAINLPLRGYYDSAQASTESESSSGFLGHFCQFFPSTYRTPADRIFKDGAHYPVLAANADDRNKSSEDGENIYGICLGGFTQIGTDPNGYAISKQNGASVPLNASMAFSGWMSSPPHKANIESTNWDGFSSFLEVGISNGYATQNFIRRDQWIECGNAHWISQHKEIPPLSWHSFHTMNLAWETWPITYSNGTSTINPGTFVNSDGTFWLSYAYSSKGDGFEYGAPALSSLIFLRGRAFAIAPHGGLVWAAAIQKITSNLTTAPTAYRLIALVHHDSEQPSDKVFNGMTSVLHVWYVDLPDVRNFAANPQAIVRGVRGSVVGAGTWPWIDANDPWTWVDGGTVDVGSDITITADPCMLKYASVWKFSPDGQHAVCLRDFGTAENVKAVLETTGLLVTDGLQALTVRLDIPVPLSSDYLSSPAPAPVITRTVDNLVDSAGVTILFPSPPFGQWSPEGAKWTMAPYAVDFDANNEPVYFYIGTFTDAGIFPSPTLQAAGSGSRHAMRPSDLANVVVIGGQYQGPDVPLPFEYHVMSVADGALLVEGSRTDFYYDREHETFPVNPEYTPCWSNTPLPVHNVSAYRAGAALDSQWLGNPNGVFLFLNDLCIVNTDGGSAAATLLPVSVSRAVQASYPKTRDGAWILTYQTCPQIGVLRKYASGVNVACSISFGGACRPTVWDYDNVTVAGAPTTATTPLVLADVIPRGGWCASSIGNQAALASLTAAPGDNFRFIYARTV